MFQKYSGVSYAVADKAYSRIIFKSFHRYASIIFLKRSLLIIISYRTIGVKEKNVIANSQVQAGVWEINKKEDRQAKSVQHIAVAQAKNSAQQIAVMLLPKI